MQPRICFHTERWFKSLHQRMDNDGPWDSASLAELALQAEKSQMVTDTNTLTCLTYIPELTPYDHQVQTAKTVIDHMHGNAILADEVGLGKTIEAGLILKEYLVRGLVKRALILVPASLVNQWSMELNQKLHIPAMAQRKAYMWEQYDILVASLDTAKRDPHREFVLQQDYDMLIIDEAHKLKNHQSKNYEFVRRLRKKYCLLLTATPIQNDLSELFHLVSLLKPGLLGDYKTFHQNFAKGKRRAKNEEHLQHTLQKVMIRNRRASEGLSLTKRNVTHLPVRLTEQERQLYDDVSQFVRRYGRETNRSQTIFSLMMLQREICSSREAAYMTLAKMQREEEREEVKAELQQLIEQIKTIPSHSKADEMVRLIQGINDKVIVFTEFRATQLYLQYKLHEHGITSVPFQGGFKRSKKDWMRQLFEHRAQVLIATEAGAEGINLQFCQHLINYDMPWNPLKVEQRIGRIHRLGQKHDVHIYNLCMEQTIEEYILYLLYEKISLFEMVIGELEEIVQRINLHMSLEEHIRDIFLHSDSQKEMEIKLNNLSNVLQSVREIENDTNKANEIGTKKEREATKQVRANNDDRPFLVEADKQTGGIVH